MTTQIDWHQELDSSFGAGADRPPSDFLVPGRKALHRRRTAIGVATLSVVVAIVGIGWAVVPALGDPRTGEVATGSASPEPTPTIEDDGGSGDRADEAVRFLGNPATYDSSGTLVTAPGWSVLERADNPMGYRRAEWTSVGLRVTRRGQEKFVLVAYQSGSTSIFTHGATGSLASWLTGVVDSQRTLDSGFGQGEEIGPGPDSDAIRSKVTMTPEGRIQLQDGAEVVEQREGAALPDLLAAQGEIVLVAEVRTEAGRTQWFVGRLVDGLAQTNVFVRPFDDLDAFVDWTTAQFESGQGLQ